jgi:hypothetical protein
MKKSLITILSLIIILGGLGIYFQNNPRVIQKEDTCIGWTSSADFTSGTKNLCHGFVIEGEPQPMVDVELGF